MKKFSIDVRASGKKEMKKARKYLRGKGLKVEKRGESVAASLRYLTNNGGDSIYIGFRYHTITLPPENTLTLPQDWNKLVEIVEEREGAACNSSSHYMDALRYGIIGCQASRPWMSKFHSGVVVPTEKEEYVLWNRTSGPVHDGRICWDNNLNMRRWMDDKGLFQSASDNPTVELCKLRNENRKLKAKIEKIEGLNEGLLGLINDSDEKIIKLKAELLEVKNKYGSSLTEITRRLKAKIATAQKNLSDLQNEH